MRDRTIYTKEGCEAIIRHIRMYREILADEEARILLLYQAAKDLGPVNAMGRVALKEKGKRFQVPEFTPSYLAGALKVGEPQTLPGYQD